MADSKSKRSPAFQFYPKDFLSSSKVQRMSLSEIGAYTILLSHCWLDGSLPTNTSEIARLVHLPAKRMARLWTGPLGECFTERNGRYINIRLEEERRIQREYRRRQSDRATHGWQSRRNAAALQDVHSHTNALLSASSSASPHKKEEEVDRTPVAMTFGTVGKEPTWDLTEGQIASWQTAYPNVRVADQCRRADIWLKANPDKRKTPQGMPRFLVNWLNKAVERGPVPFAATGTEGRGRTGAPPKGKYDGLEES